VFILGSLLEQHATISFVVVADDSWVQKSLHEPFGEFLALGDAGVDVHGGAVALVQAVLEFEALAVVEGAGAGRLAVDIEHGALVGDGRPDFGVTLGDQFGVVAADVHDVLDGLVDVHGCADDRTELLGHVLHLDHGVAHGALLLLLAAAQHAGQEVFFLFEGGFDLSPTLLDVVVQLVAVAVALRVGLEELGALAVVESLLGRGVEGDAFAVDGGVVVAGGGGGGVQFGVGVGVALSRPLLCLNLSELHAAHLQVRQLVFVCFPVHEVLQEAVAGFCRIQVGHVAALPDLALAGLAVLAAVVLHDQFDLLLAGGEFLLANPGRVAFAFDHGVAASVAEFLDLHDVGLGVVLREEVAHGVVADHVAHTPDFGTQVLVLLVVGFELLRRDVKELRDLDVPGDGHVEGHVLGGQQVGRVLHEGLLVLVRVRRCYLVQVQTHESQEC